MRSPLLAGVCAWTLATVLAGPILRPRVYWEREVSPILSQHQFFRILRCLPRPRPTFSPAELEFYNLVVGTAPRVRPYDGLKLSEVAQSCLRIDIKKDPWDEFIQSVANLALTSYCVDEEDTPECFEEIETFYGTTPTRLLSSELQTLSDNMCGMAKSSQDLADDTRDLGGRLAFAREANRYNCASNYLKTVKQAIAGKAAQDTPQQDQDTLQQGLDTSQEGQDTSTSPGFSSSSLDPLWSVAGKMATVGGLLAVPLTGWARSQGGVATQ